MRSQLKPKEQEWFDSLTEEEVEEMRNGWADLNIKAKGVVVVTFDQFKVTCAKVAVKLHKYDNKKMPKRVKRAFDKAEQIGKEGKI